MLGRAAERAALGALLAGTLEGQSAVALVQGEAGMGKSCLVADFVERAAELHGISALVGRNDSTEYAATLLPWRRIFRPLLGTGPSDDADRVHAALDGWLRRHPDLHPFAPLLNAVLRIEVPETEATRHLQGPSRADAMLRVAIDFFVTAAPAPRLVVLEDCHWMDGDSWRLAQAVARLPQTLVVLTARPTPLPVEASWLTEHPRCQQVVLGPLDTSAIAQVVQRHLHARSVGGSLVAEVQRRSAGHPLMAIEYALLLTDSLRAAERDGHVSLRGGAQGLPLESGPPPSVQSLLASRIDHLDAREQHALKVASAIGLTFTAAMLRRIDRGSLDDDVLDRLVERQLLERADATGSFAFRHSLVREVTYGLMLTSQRRALHVAIAKELEQSGKPSDTALLAHHCYHAGDYERTVRHADSAAASALRTGGYREAVYFLDLCLRICPSLTGWTDATTQTRWQRQLADAYYGLGNLVARRIHARNALRASGREPAPSRTAKALAVAAGLSRRVVHRATARPPRSRARAMGPSGLDLARAYRHMVELAYFDNDALGMVWGALAAIDVAERSPPSFDLSLAYAQLGGAMGLAGAHPLATWFVESAIRAARDAGEPHAEGYAHMCNALYRVGLGSWAAAAASVARCQELGARTRDHVTWGYAEVVRFWTHYYLDESADARRSAQHLRAEADRNGHAQHAAWALRCEALLEARSGAYTRAVSLLEEAHSLLSETQDANEIIMIHGTLGLARMHLGHRDAAITSATQVLQIGVGARRPTNHATLTGVVAAVEVAYELWRSEPQAEAWRRLTLRGIDALRRYRNVFPIAEPAFRYWRGRVRSVDGRRHRARSDWQHGLSAARTLGMLAEQRLLGAALRSRWS
jgi:tetratricopeptide (TPR) repeat protein